ncbi:Gfo/Idh/MocA family oxidoreductase [Phycicoccus sp. CSK15P-2]|uniref:Gfo/Idh/MocA family protein n=1 Tax=Phycicoccus sp. CSK15P-2 TaxID=2807627 RepID=UPI001951DB73|nr:Gfo/Idh/MocA family oxidoreductase [Phycicoccus sp. CSK15P-2]MBM6405148.1 Gfo/Idh/MocA family oxidoreductase [Phycicoccus sp. CSK15P-2]
MPRTTPTLAAPTVPDPMEAPPLRWGVLGPGGIANTFANAVRSGTRSEVVAVGSRSKDRASAYARRHGVARSHGSYEDLVADDTVDAVYVSSPHSEHRDHALLALRAGKPVLVEKAFARSLAETDEVLAAARDAGLFAAEAMWARYMPQYDIVRRTVEAGTIGDVVLVQADHGQLLWPDGPQRLSDPALAGGSLLDLGVYPIAFADHLLGELDDVAARGTLSDQGVDVTVGVTGRVGSALARMTSTMAAATPCDALVAGTAGRVELTGPGHFYAAGSVVRLVSPDGDLLDEWVPETSEHGFRFQAAEVARALAEARTEAWSVPWEATRRVMAVMDEVRRQVGVVYPGE